jgi:DNA-directed DNA polymerase
MICSGYYIEISGNKDEKFNVIYKSEGKDGIIYLGKDNNIVSAYKIKDNVKYAFNNKLAEKVYGVIKNGIQGATAKNGTPVPFKYGAASMHYFKKHSIDYEVEKFNGEMVHIAISDKRFNLNLDFYEGDFKEAEINYVRIENESIANINVDDVPVRSLEEIALEKDISWLKDKKYYVVNDNATAEALFSQLEKYKGIIAVDYETTGLKINMFGQYGSKRRAELEKYNLEHPDSPIKTDSVVGIIFCVEEGVSYYFPVGHRKFDNLYSKRDEVCIRTIRNIKARYTVGDHRDDFSEYGVFIRNLPESDFTPDIILMERIRDILEKCNMLAHNGSFEYKVSLLYNIDLNLKEDTMLMHQLMYKFRSTTSNKGEPSNLKYLTKVEFNIEQLSLEDFFANYKEDNKGTVRNSKASTIDFSYMDYKGTKAYGPADGDFTLALYKIYKKDLKTKYKDMEYIYNVEVIVAMAIGYMEFYGLRIDEEKIEQANTKSLNDMLLLEHKIRKIANYSSENEDKIYDSLLEAKEANNLEKESSLLASLRAEIDASENVLNLNSPAQVSSLFYDILKYPCKDGDRSVGKKVIKSLTKAKDKDGSPKYPAVGLYREYKDLSSLVTKFFGKLPDFMYPGGFFFSSFGQISTATGRMSCLDEDTLVTTVGGVKKIKDVKVGDLVYCYDDNGDIRIKPVLNVIYKGYKDCIELTYKKSKSKTTNKLVCTPDHKIKTVDFGWKEAKDCINKKVYHYSDKSTVYLEGCKIIDSKAVGKRNVYDLEIEGIHNFIANEICVHNCSRPNSQQLPKSVTKIIVPRDNYIEIDADFSQIEYRTMTALAMEAHLIEQFRDPDSDFHTIMASVMYQVPYASVTPEMRSSAKSFNFGIPYGMGLKSLSILLFGDSTQEHVEKAKELYELYFKDQQNIRKFFDRAKETASVYKFNKTYFNRVRAYSFVDADGNFSEAKKAMALRQAGNFIIQGCLSGDTIIQTKEYGFTKIKDVAGCCERLHIWDGKDWTKGDVLYSGKKRKCIITLNDDRKIICSPNHKFLVVSHRGNTRFVECKDLIGKDVSSSPHRIVINGEYSPSDYKYSSNWARCFTTNNKQAHNYFVDDIKNSFDAGVMLGRLASDGSIFLREFGLSSSIRHIVAEHEFSIMPYLEKIMSCYKFVSKVNPLREDRNQRMAHISVFSSSLTAEIENLDIKHSIDSYIAQDTEMLRGFLRGMFDGDGGFMGETIGLTFGWQYDFEDLCREIQKYLLMFGIRSYYDRIDGIKHLIRIRKADNIKFLDTIGFINEAKNDRGYKCVASKKEKVFGRSLYVESVEITDEEIDMYDIYNTDRGYFVADGVITHNSSADIFKIAVARNFSFIRRNKLFGKILITNMVHDEMLFEVDCNCINVKKALAEIIKNMEFKLEGFPPLYVGAGVNMSWASAKGKMSEIHPVLANTFIDEAENLSIYSDKPVKNTDIQNYFNDRVYQFRVNKIIDYLKDENNHNKEISPIIGNLLSLQFDYGVNKEFDSKYTEENGYSKEEIEMHKKNIPLEQLKRFIADKKVDIDPNLFKGATIEIEKDKDVAYSDEDDLDVDEFENESNHIFALIEEDTSKYGISIQDLIKEFGLFVSVEMSICGIDLKKVSKSKKEDLYKMLEEHECNFDDEGSLQVVFLGANNNLIRTDVYVNNLTTVDVADRLHINTLIA